MTSPGPNQKDFFKIQCVLPSRMDELKDIGTIGYDLLNSSSIMVHIPIVPLISLAQLAKGKKSRP
jgi:hypothetical protein